MTQIHNWQTESVRVTFLGSPEGSGKSLSWSSVTGVDPETVTNKPAQQIKTEEGVWENGHLVLSVNPARIDFTYTGLPPADFKGTPNLGDFAEVSKKLEKALKQTEAPKCARIAIGARLQVLFSSQAECVKFLRNVMPGLAIDDECVDIMLQFNRQKKLKQSGVLANRIVRWSQLMVQTFAVPVGSEKQFLENKQVLDGSVASVQYVVQLELDYNTAPGAALPHATAYWPIVSSLLSEAREASIIEGVKV